MKRDPLYEIVDGFTDDDLYLIEKFRRGDVEIIEPIDSYTPCYHLLSEDKREYFQKKFRCILKGKKCIHANFYEINAEAYVNCFCDRLLIDTENNRVLRNKIYKYMYQIDNSITIVGDNKFICVLLN